MTREMRELHDAFESLTADVVPLIAHENLASSSWRVGRRRRARERVVTAGVVALVAGLLWMALPVGRELVSLQPAGEGDADRAATYPQRISGDLPTKPLPRRPGPLAGAMYRDYRESNQWYAVTADGLAWTLSGGLEPAPSPDGRLLLTMGYGDRARLVLRDLVAGTQKAYPQIVSDRDQVIDPHAEYQVSLSSALYGWSADSTRALLSVSVRHGNRWEDPKPAALDVETGTVTMVRAPGSVAGFASENEVVTVAWRDKADPATPQQVAHLENLDTGVVRDVPLSPSTTWTGIRPTGHLISVSLDGSTLMAIEAGENAAEGDMRFFSLTDGTQTDSRHIERWESGCPLAWSGKNPVIAQTTRGSYTHPVAVTIDGMTSVVAVDPSLRGKCVVWAAKALSGPPSKAFFGSSQGFWTWHPYLTGGAILAVLGLTVTWLRRRCRPGRPQSS